jgi:hypothetical protein
MVVVLLVASLSLAAADPAVEPSDDKTPKPILMGRTISSDTYQNPDGSKTMFMYGSVANVLEDRVWKPLAEARSLKGKEGIKLVYLKYDGQNDFIVDDFNMTSITFRINTTNTSANVVFKWANSTNAGASALVSKTGTYTLKLNNIFDQNFTVGDHSTTITLQTKDADNIGDGYGRMYSTSMNTNYGTSEWLDAGWYPGLPIIFDSVIKWNLTLDQRIGAGKTIDKAQLGLYMAAGYYTAAEYPNISVFGGYGDNTTWVELGTSWNANKLKITYNTTQAKNWSSGATNSLLASNRSLAGDTVNTWQLWDVTSWVRANYNTNAKNATLEVYQQQYNATQTNGYFAYKSKDYTGDTTKRPMLIITYSDGAPPEDTCTYTDGDWAVDCADDCLIANPMEVTGHITITGTGTFVALADITGWLSVIIKGTDAANQCRVICDGGCFRK